MATSDYLTLCQAFCVKPNWITINVDVKHTGFQNRKSLLRPAKLIITDRGSAFTANEFETYCSEEGIQHLKITTGIPRGNGQIERMHRILIPVLSKLSHDDRTKWFKHVPTVQRVINSSSSRNTKYTPFELMMGTQMKNKEDIKVNEVLHEESKPFDA
ncbi:hypothetical protein AVEN_84554-1 [Araneus ventricosus]|uniref:Integrase catalytic domain-containing protein n=1 Tax=Araneus ventricosus TaxID=182803 RepID=A0A4Y2L7H4_ARAVE|nr:hypothetical protein AVEN_84554-1 [Araneus ventricosus]